ncbi:MAG: Ig-like domain-containing protein, partial [Muribaculaceae bacterium]|nr:Ig-like domain-containing protein [Muribaculaceae bacterium]
ISIGTATITVSCGDVKATCLVTVVATPVESISISQDFAQLSIGESIRLTGIIIPENASDKTIIWSSSDESIALVDAEGNVTAIGGGEADIIATSAENSKIKAVCHVIVNPLMVESIVLSPYSYDGLPGDNFYITAKVYPENATDRTLSWSSSDVTIASVDSDGFVKAIAPGNVIITAQANDGSGVGAICSVTVNPILVESIQLTPENLNGEEGHFYKIEATVLPENASEKTLIWSSSDESVAAINSEGVVYILKEGECVITATASDGSGVTAECIVTGVAGIDSIFSDNGSFDIYSVNGTLIRKDCDNDHLKTLAPDVYIIRHGNLTKKLIIH